MQLRPFVVVRRTAEEGVFSVENVGQAVALNVRVGDVVVGKINEKAVSVHFPETVPVLRAGRRWKLRAQALVGTRPVHDPMLSAHLDEEYAKQSLTATVQYENVEGRTYAVSVTVAPKRATVGSVR